MGTPYLTAMLDQESTFGKNKANAKTDAGKAGYIMGFTKVAAEELKRNKIRFNADTPQGAIDASAAYSNLKMDVRDAKGKVVKTITDKAELYDTRYKTKSGADSKANFQKKLELYSKIK